MRSSQPRVVAFSRAMVRASGEKSVAVMVGPGEVGGDGDGDCAGACADVGDMECAFVVKACGPEEDGFDEVFGFGAGDEDRGCDAEGEAVELLLAGDVLERLVRGAAGDKGVVLREGDGVEIGFGMGEEPGAVAVERVGEEGFCIAAGIGRGQVGGGFGDGFAEGHKGQTVDSRQ